MPVKRRMERYQEAVQSSDVNVVFDELAVLLSNSFAAMLFLLVMGILLAGGSLDGFVLAAVALAVVIDLGSELWLFQSPFQYPDEKLQKIILVHYGIQLAAYTALALTLLNVAPGDQFLLYAGFLLLWLIGFVVGEVIVVFMDNRYEARYGS